jgi:hypothetical protein
MAAVATELGSFQGRLPYPRIGTGAAQLVVLPGLALATTTPRGLTLAAYARGFRRLAQDPTRSTSCPGRAGCARERPRWTSPPRTPRCCGRWASGSVVTAATTIAAIPTSNPDESAM